MLFLKIKNKFLKRNNNTLKEAISKLEVFNNSLNRCLKIMDPLVSFPIVLFVCSFYIRVCETKALLCREKNHKNRSPQKAQKING